MPAVVVPIATWVAGVVSTAGAAIGITGAAGAWLAAGTYVVTEAALYAGMSYAIDTVSRPKLKPPGSELQFNIDPAYPREWLVGTRQVGGSMVARYSHGSNLYNAHLVIQLADHPCTELSKIYDGGRLVLDTPLTHGVRTELTAYSYSGGARVWATWHDGRPGQTADSDLVTKSALDPEVVAGKIEGWTSDHKGAGCAYVHVEVQWDSDILTSLPQFTWLVKGAPLYDRRLDTTAGGSGTHRLDDPSTWAYSTNAMVALDHFLLGYQVEDDPLAFGIGLSPLEVPYAQFAAAADLCDEDVITGTGGDVETIKRYAANAVVSAGDFFEDVIEAFQIQMAARVVDLGGRIGIIGAEEKAITIPTLTDDDLIAGEPLQFADKLPFNDLIGSITGTFADPANNYQPTPYTPLITQYQALPDGGEAQAVTLPLPYEVHPRRADRLISAWAARETLQPRLVAVFSPKAWTLEPGDWFEFTSARLQIADAKFEVIDIVKSDDFTVTLTARAADADFLAFDNDNDPDLSVPPDIPPVSLLLDEPEFDVVVTTLTAGSVVEPALEVTLTSDETVAREIIYEYAVWSGGVLVDPSYVDSAHASQVVTKLRKSILPSTAYKVRAKSRAGRRESPWTAWSSPVTTGATYAVGSAAAVPWTGVTTRPANLSVLAGTENINNVLVQAGANNLLDTQFRWQATYWAKSSSVGTTTFSQVTSTGGLRKSLVTGASVTVNGTNFVRQHSTAQQAYFACKPGDVVGARCLIGGDNISAVELTIVWRDASGASISTNTKTAVTSGILAGTGEETTFNELVNIGTAPASTVCATIDMRGIASTTAPVLRVAKPFMAVLPVGQTVVPQYSPGLEHEVNANNTETRTAAAITGQDFGATAAQAIVDNRLAPVGINGLTDTEFRFQSAQWTKSSGSGTTTFSVVTSTGGLRSSLVTGASVTVGDFIRQYSNAQRARFPVRPGDVVGVRCLVAVVNCSSFDIRIAFRDAANALVNYATSASVSTGLLTGTGEAVTFNEATHYGTAGAGAVTAEIEVRAIASTSAPVLKIAQPMMARLASGQSVPPLFAPGVECAPGADQTSANTAAAIASQGTQATANAQRGTSYTGTPVEGSWWADTSTTPNKLKFYTGGAWQEVATLVSAAATNPLTVAFSPLSVNTTHSSSTPLSQAVVATPSGGSGTYTYVWAVAAVYVGATPTLSGQYTNTCTVGVTHTAAGTIDGVISCTVTDTVTGKVVTKYWGYYSQGTGGGGGAGNGGGLPP